MEQMTGTCLFCGQTRLVEAEDQNEANRIASETCTCDNNLKRVRQCSDNIEKICGETAKDYGMDIVVEDVIDELKEVGKLCVFELLLGDNLQGRKDHIALNGHKYIDMADLS